MLLKNFNETIHKYASQSHYAYDIFAIFHIVSHIIYYLTWVYVDQQGYENIVVRVIIISLTTILLMRHSWPTKLKAYVPLYWYITVTFCLPVFFTFMLLKNGLSYGWSLNSLTGTVLCILFLDHRSQVVLIPTGILFGYLLYVVTGPNPPLPIEQFKTIFITYGSIFIFGFLLSKRTLLHYDEKKQTLKSAAGAIAHEMRTPLSVVSMSSMTIREISESLESNSKKRVSQNSLDDDIDFLRETSVTLDKVAKRSQKLINVLLMNLNQDFENLPTTKLSMQQVTFKALEDFVYQSHEKDKIHVDIKSDFVFQGNEEIITHVFFNLLKNSFYFIQAANKGEIYITISAEGTYNQVIFKDTGPGIKKSRLPNIFKPFYSKRPHGTGVGLSFCKRAIEGMGGTITVTSEFNEHTTFIIRLPK